MRRTLPVAILPVICIFLFACRCKKEDNPPGTTEPLEFPDEIFLSPGGSDSHPGTREEPLRNIALALLRLKPGGTLTFLEGTYPMNAMIRITKQGSADSVTVIRGDPGKTVIIDGAGVNIGTAGNYPYTQGAIQIGNSSHLVIRDLIIKNSSQAGINLNKSDHIDIINCTTLNTFCSGISAWIGTSCVNVLGNTVVNANDPEMAYGTFTGNATPHEAISIAGTDSFEVAWNLVRDCQKEGIDVKETSCHGTVHHNLVHHMDRQGLYIDAWFGVLEDIEMHHNVVHHCEAGIAISSEDGPNSKDLCIHHNLVYRNRATGLFFSRWGEDNMRENVRVYNNTFYRNGYGNTEEGNPDYWLTGGLYLFSSRLKDVFIYNNILSRNKPFELGHTADYDPGDFEEKNIRIAYNLINDINTVPNPFYMKTWTKDTVWSITGDSALLQEPLFADPANADFRLKGGDLIPV